jgi:hypothetical protein
VNSGSSGLQQKLMACGMFRMCMEEALTEIGHGAVAYWVPKVKNVIGNRMRHVMEFVLAVVWL